MTLLLRLARQSLLLWFGAAFLAGGLFFVGMGIRDGSRERAYRTHAEPVDAVVLAKTIRRASRDGNASTRYEIAYRFTAADGRTIDGTDVVTVDEWERLQPGRTFKVTYLPAAPDGSRAAGSGDMASPLIAIGLGGIFGLVAALFVTSARRLRRQWRILREGLTGRGTVVGIEPSNVSINNRRQWEVRYRYQDHLGRDHEGTSGPVSPDAVDSVTEGDTVEVRFDRERPERSVWVEPASRPTTTPLTSQTRRPPLWKRLRGFAVMLGILFTALIAAETVPALKALDRLAVRHEVMLTAIAIGATVVGFVLFMGGILYRIFGGAGRPMSHADVEDLSRSVRNAGPAAARASAYRFFGRSAGSSFQDEFSLKEAKQAWRQGAWRTSPRWRGNFVVTVGALVLTVGLFGIFVATGPAGIKLLCAAAIGYVGIRIVVAFVRA